MRVAIVVRSGPAAGRRIQLKASQMARFGRSNWADFAFAEDSTLEDIHFEIYCDTRACTLTSLAKDSPTLVNQQPVTRALLHSGDVIKAGQTQLAVDIHGGNELPEMAPAVEAVAAVAVDPQLTAKMSAYIELSMPALELAKTHADPATFEQSLLDAQLWQDAVRWRAHRLPKPQAVTWMLNCVDQSAVPVDPQDREVVQAWSTEPSEENRRAAMRRLEANGSSGLGGALVAAAAWSGGSLAPEGLDPIEPDERLTGHCVATALGMLSHLSQTPGPAVERLKGYLRCE